MDHFKVLKRAWEITWRYRALWIFGIILALTAGGGGGGNGNVTVPGPQERFPEIDVPGPPVWLILTVIGVIVLFAIVFTIASAIAGYVSENALIKMVDEREETGTEHGVKEGFRLGWSRSAWRFFLIDLVTRVPMAILIVGMILVALAPLLLLLTESQVVNILGVVLTIGLVFLIAFLGILLGIALSLLQHFFRRVCAIEDVGVFESIAEGARFTLGHIGDILIQGLIMFGVGLLWGIVMLFVGLGLLLLAVFVGAVPTLSVFGIASFMFGDVVPWILAGLVAVGVLIVVIGLPSLFLNGLMMVFRSTVWTLTYRELRGLDRLEMREATA